MYLLLVMSFKFKFRMWSNFFEYLIEISFYISPHSSIATLTLHAAAKGKSLEEGWCLREERQEIWGPCFNIYIDKNKKTYQLTYMALVVSVYCEEKKKAKTQIWRYRLRQNLMSSEKRCFFLQKNDLQCRFKISTIKQLHPLSFFFGNNWRFFKI